MVSMIKCALQFFDWIIILLLYYRILQINEIYKQ